MRICEHCHKAPVWGTDKNTGIGYCKSHQYLRTDIDKRSLIQKAMDKISSLKNDEVDENILPEIKDERFKTAIDRAKEMEVFWKYAEGVVEESPFCIECGSKILEKYYHDSVAHIFPKAIFDSVADDKENFLVLGAGCGCHQKTHLLESFSKMSCFVVAVEKYQKFKHKITEQHKYQTLFENHIVKLNT